MFLSSILTYCGERKRQNYISDHQKKYLIFSSPYTDPPSKNLLNTLYTLFIANKSWDAFSIFFFENVFDTSFLHFIAEKKIIKVAISRLKKKHKSTSKNHKIACYARKNVIDIFSPRDPYRCLKFFRFFLVTESKISISFSPLYAEIDLWKTINTGKYLSIANSMSYVDI